ncbi:hypothetical protein B0H67DRAFT_553737 [Lasiosphaeris hirsuta]|uniref:Uncharacterized protein n=1 Tax=Lasiosphaeris hirsuta TaxID=260670 RepID=A0AA40AG07_9PEZI|nr:hypothetical protein B0H67DRAFT_553737 [Lasiosphaeris hirsuta]
MAETQNFPCQWKPLQGRVIPVYYGGSTCDGRRAIVLFDASGVDLYSEKFGSVTKSAVKEKLQLTIRAILELGVEPADHSPRNYRIVGDAAFVVDFEGTAEVDPEQVEELTDAVADSVAHWAAFYQKHSAAQATRHGHQAATLAGFSNPPT